MIPSDWFEQASQRIAPHTVRTPLTYDPRADLYLKWENHQVTGSFKARGALNKVLSMTEWERAAGLVAASAGNHGQGVALAAKLSHAQAEVFVPASAVPNKVQAIRALGAAVIYVDGGYGDSEVAAKEHAAVHGRTYVSPYNDGQVIAGQGTIALEVVTQLSTDFQTEARSIASWIMPTGGGGLISGCGAALQASGVEALLFGVQAGASAFTYALMKRGTQDGAIDGPTLADGLSGPLDATSMTIPLMREFMNEIVVVDEEAIARAIAHAWWAHGERIEGSAAVALAAALGSAVTARPAVVVITGGNIEPSVFAGIIARYREGLAA